MHTWRLWQTLGGVFWVVERHERLYTAEWSILRAEHSTHRHEVVPTVFSDRPCLRSLNRVTWMLSGFHRYRLPLVNSTRWSLYIACIFGQYYFNEPLCSCPSCCNQWTNCLSFDLPSLDLTGYKSGCTSGYNPSAFVTVRRSTIRFSTR